MVENIELIGKQHPLSITDFFGGGPSIPDPPAVPPPPPVAPAPTPTETSSGKTVEGRQRQVAMLKYGSLGSTVTNQGGTGGITGGGADLYPSMSAGTAGRQTTGGS